ncbi:MAG: NAD(P)H-hydrate epimerase [Firmicutes bacterium]|nr:NAD(P)H-hydrate epimerase [Bacillota bacterium]
MDAVHEVVTCAEMKEIERSADAAGTSYYQMMENAGTSAFHKIVERFPDAGPRAAILCGKGNNGGDGFVVARKLKEAGWEPVVVLVDGYPKTTDSVANFGLLGPLGVSVKESPEDPAAVLQGAGLVVDAIYGTGFHGELKPEVRTWTQAVNQSGAKVAALDIPSGLNGDLGQPDPDTVRADLTISFHRYKPVHGMEDAVLYCGEIVLGHIGI